MKTYTKYNFILPLSFQDFILKIANDVCFSAYEKHPQTFFQLVYLYSWDPRF